MPAQYPKARRQQPRLDPNRGAGAPEMVDMVDPAWIIKALASMFALAILCAYITLCVLFWRSQWQIVLHPSASLNATPAAQGMAFTDVHFGVDATGQPQLAGWFIPSDPSAPTALMLPSGQGSRADALAQARTLHVAHLNVLLFDYRGFGTSAGPHPTQARMQADAESALTYLTATRSLAQSSIVVYGTGLGASLAVKLCSQHPDLPAVILDSSGSTDAPDGDLAAQARRDPRAALVPFALLFREDFPLAAPLADLHTPKLLITHANGSAPPTFLHAANPKTTVELGRSGGALMVDAVSRFVAAYVAGSAGALLQRREAPKL